MKNRQKNRKNYLRILWPRIVSFFVATVCLLAKLTDSIFHQKNHFCSKDKSSLNTISFKDLVEISVSNLKTKKARTLITIGGMTLGIAAIVFLVSIGYGTQKLVINRVARLEEMRQADISLQAGGKLKINDKALMTIHSLNHVESVLPLISVVGKVNYQNSSSDMAVYGVTSNYLEQSAIKPTHGKIFESNELGASIPKTFGEVAGISIDETISNGSEIGNIQFNINSDSWVKVREKPNTNSKIIGYTRRVEGQNQGLELWGGSYVSRNGTGEASQDRDGNILGKWIKTTVLIWKKEPCTVDQPDCEENQYLIDRDNNGKQTQQEAYIAESKITVSSTEIIASKVLGESTENSKNATSSSSLELVEIASESATVVSETTKTVNLAESSKKQAILNTAALSVLGLDEDKAVGKKFNVSFVVVGDLLDDNSQKIESILTEYTIIGIISNDKTPIFYVPFIDLKSLGISNYSQAKLVVDNQNNLKDVRHQIESMGYVTSSVSDTVEQINSLFATAKTFLALLGLFALIIAALGMFNTLTVSLLEKTREIGLMKAMGMKSSEVKKLFLIESVIIGLFGGFLGVVVGYLLGGLLNVVLSTFAVFKGVGAINITYVPPLFILVVFVLSFAVGTITGIYPARRATKISALNALRYE